MNLSILSPNVRKWLTYATLIAIILGLLYYGMKTIEKLNKENDRLESNLENINFDFDKTKTKNGELMYSVNALTVKASELELINSTLNNSLTNLGVKIKNLQSATDIRYVYNTTYDTIYIDSKISKFKYSYKHPGKYTEFTSDINIPSGLFSADSTKFSPYLTDVKFKLKDSLLIAHEWQYKRSWIFWKKVVGVKVHIKSENPDFELEQVKTFQITK